MTTRLTPVTDEMKTALMQARISMMANTSLVFFAAVIMNMEQAWDEQVDTFMTDGFSYSLNPDFFMSLKTPERVYILGMISIFTGYFHPARMESREPKLWTTACQQVAHHELTSRRLKPLPGANIIDKYKGWKAEDIYEDMRKNQQPGGSEQNIQSPGLAAAQSASNNTGGAANSPSEGMSGAEQLQAMNDMVQQAVSQAQQQGCDPGDIPGDIQMLLDKLNNSKLPWHVILQRWMNRFDKDDYSMRKPNKRFMPEYYLPSLWSETMITIACAVDISGSVSDEDFKQIISHVAKILTTIKPEKIILIQFDTKLQHIDVIHDMGDLMKVQFHGRGGTNVTCVLDWAEKNKPEGLIIFSDGEFHHPRESFATDTLWLTHDNKDFTAPFGKVIHYEMEHNKGRGW